MIRRPFILKLVLTLVVTAGLVVRLSLSHATSFLACHSVPLHGLHPRRRSWGSSERRPEWRGPRGNRRCHQEAAWEGYFSAQERSRSCGEPAEEEKQLACAAARKECFKSVLHTIAFAHIANLMVSHDIICGANVAIVGMMNIYEGFPRIKPKLK